MSKNYKKISPTKLPTHLECPFDNILYIIIKPLASFFHALNFTPNMLTTISTIFGALSFYFLYRKREVLFITCLLVYYIFDCLDGYYARKYEMCTKFGDYYDHIKDLIIATLILCLVFYRLYKQKYYIIIFLLSLASVLVFIHMSCQETYTNKNIIPLDHPCHSHTLHMFNMCPPEKYRKILRFFGVGFFIIFLCVIVVYTKISR